MVSIIVPVYNCEKYISTCIDSILGQNESSIEVIIVDDGSNDNTASILDAYQKRDDRIHVFHVENGGPSKARNIGLDKATGDWVLFVDADDWVDSNILSELNLNENSPDIIFFGFKKCYDNMRQESCLPIAFGYTSDRIQIFEHLNDLFNSKDEFFGYSVNKVYKRSIIEKFNIRFKDELRVREDEVFALDYCQHIDSIMTISFAPYNYRILEESLSHSKQISFRNYQFLIEIEKNLLNFYPSTSFKNAFLNRIYKYYIFSIVECIYLNRQEKFDIINNAIIFYNNYKRQIIVPKWQLVLFTFPIAIVKRYLIYMVFYFRNILLY